MAAPVRTPKREETEQWIEWFKERSDDATKGGNPPKGASPNADAALELPTAGIRGTLREKSSRVHPRFWSLTGSNAG